MAGGVPYSSLLLGSFFFFFFFPDAFEAHPLDSGVDSSSVWDHGPAG